MHSADEHNQTAAALQEHPHRRNNPLTGEWVLVSPHRSKRPWNGREEEPERSDLPQHDPGCYLCPGNSRVGGEINPEYDSTFVFTNDFSALLPKSFEPAAEPDHPLLRAEPETGHSRVICYSPRHDLAMARMDREHILAIIRTWREQYQDLGAMPDVSHVQIFENRGSIMGCSNPHPHGQIWANSTLPDIPASEDLHQREHLGTTGKCLLCEYEALERSRDERIILANDSFLVLVPFWAMWPFETMVLPRRHMAAITEMTETEQEDLAKALSGLCIRYDNLFSCSFPYSMGIHQAPTSAAADAFPHWHWHMHFYPPLLRSRSVKKFMVGYEMMAAGQRDITPEDSASRLRALSPVHYLDRQTIPDGGDS